MRRVQVDLHALSFVGGGVVNRTTDARQWQWARATTETRSRCDGGAGPSGVSTPEQLNRLSEQDVDPAGRIHQKQLPPAVAEGSVQGSIAGGGFEPPTSGL